MNTLNAKHITLKTLEGNKFDRNEFDAYMAEFGKTTRNNNKMNIIEIVENNEVVDYAQPIVITHNGERFYEVYLSEMENNWNLAGEAFSTIFDTIEFGNNR